MPAPLAGSSPSGPVPQPQGWRLRRRARGGPTPLHGGRAGWSRRRARRDGAVSAPRGGGKGGGCGQRNTQGDAGGEARARGACEVVLARGLSCMGGPPSIERGVYVCWGGGGVGAGEHASPAADMLVGVQAANAPALGGGGRTHAPCVHLHLRGRRGGSGGWDACCAGANARVGGWVGVRERESGAARRTSRLLVAAAWCGWGARACETPPPPPPSYKLTHTPWHATLASLHVVGHASAPIMPPRPPSHREPPPLHRAARRRAPATPPI